MSSRDQLPRRSLGRSPGTLVLSQVDGYLESAVGVPPVGRAVRVRALPGTIDTGALEAAVHALL